MLQIKRKKTWFYQRVQTPQILILQVWFKEMMNSPQYPRLSLKPYVTLIMLGITTSQQLYQERQLLGAGLSYLPISGKKKCAKSSKTHPGLLHFPSSLLTMEGSPYFIRCWLNSGGDPNRSVHLCRVSSSLLTTGQLCNTPPRSLQRPDTVTVLWNLCKTSSTYQLPICFLVFTPFWHLEAKLLQQDGSWLFPGPQFPKLYSGWTYMGFGGPFQLWH